MLLAAILSMLIALFSSAAKGDSASSYIKSFLLILACFNMPKCTKPFKALNTVAWGRFAASSMAVQLHCLFGYSNKALAISFLFSDASTNDSILVLIVN